MPSKKRKYNARFPAGRIKKIMQTDEEVGKVAQAVPIIISRTLELFVESLLSKAMQVTLSRNAKTLSPSHVKQCILSESRFDFLRDLVNNIPDVSAAEEKELQMSAESSPNSSRFSDTSAPPKRIGREDSNSSSSCDVRIQHLPKTELRRGVSADSDKPRVETITAPPVPTDAAIDLTTKKDEVRTANFYQETLTDPVQHRSVITPNPTYGSPQPSTSSYATLTLVDTIKTIEVPKDLKPHMYIGAKQNNNVMTPPKTPVTPVTPVINIDFSKNLSNPEIKVLEPTVAGIVGPKDKKLQRQNSRTNKSESKREKPPPLLNIDHLNSGNLQIDEDYDT